MVTTRSRRKAATPVSVGPSSPITPIRPESPLQTPKSPARPLKRRRNRDVDDSPVPLKLRKESTESSEPFRPQTPIRLPGLVSESDPDSRCPQSNPESDAAIVEENRSENEQDPIYVPKLFKQDVVARDWSDVGQHTSLEYFQAFPHDPRSTLCVKHFFSLVEKWYWKRKPTVHSQLMPILKDTTTRPDFSNLALPVSEETCTIKDVQSFKDELSKKITNTLSACTREYHRVGCLTGHKPKCEIFDATSAFAYCSMCAQSPDFQPPANSVHDTWLDTVSFELFKDNAEELRRVRHLECEYETPVVSPGTDEKSSSIECKHKTCITILGTNEERSYTECEDCGHRKKAGRSRLRTIKYAIEVGGVRFPVQVAPTKPMTMNSKVMHVDVGGIHIVVDQCRQPLIRFRSTCFSHAHEKEGFDYHDQDEIEVIGQGKLDSVYSRPGAFNPTTSCSGSFDNCACH